MPSYKCRHTVKKLDDNIVDKDFSYVKRAHETIGFNYKKPYEVYELPSYIKDRLAEIDKEQLGQQDNEQSVSRFYKRARLMIDRNNNDSIKEKLKRNAKLCLVVFCCFLMYYYYNEYVRDKGINTIDDLIASLPMELDEVTTLTKIENDQKEIKMFFQKSADAFEGQSAEMINATLDTIEANANLLCNNAVFRAQVDAGKTLVITLDVADSPYKRTYKVEKCETNSIN